MKGSTRGYIALCFSIWFVSLIIASAAWLNTLAELEAPIAMPVQAGEQYANIGGTTIHVPANNHKDFKRI